MIYPTPCYIFDIPKLKDRVAYLRSHLPQNIKLCYAVKANPFLVKELETEVDRFELCSEGEYRICQAVQVDAGKYVISGVYKEASFIEEIVRDVSEIGHYTVESMIQFELLKKLSEKYKKKILVLLRLTSNNQFGIDKESIKEIVKNCNQYPYLEIQGIQFFSGTQKTSLKRMEKELRKVDDFISELKEEYGFETKEFEFGPGFPAFYFKGDEFDEENYLKDFSALISNLQFQGEITLELGRSIAFSCGNYYTKVVDQKINHNEGYAIVDGGIHQLVYFGQSMAMKQPKLRVLQDRQGQNSEEHRKWNICGSLCTVNDIMVKQLLVPHLEVGDILEFQNTGAYCMTEGISLFLSRDLPQVFLRREEDTLQCVRQRIETAFLNKPNYE